MGKQTIDEISGEYIRLHRLLHDDPDQAEARRRLSDFDAEDTQGVVRTLSVDIPFFFSNRGCCLPLVALQYMQPEVVIQFRHTVDGFDPTYQPQIAVVGEYVFLDDTEREWWTKDSHDMLIPYIQSIEDRVDIEPTKLYVSNTPTGNQLAIPQVITGTAGDRPQTDVITIRGDGQESYISLVTPIFPGESAILYDGGTSASSYSLNAAMLVPIDAGTGGRVAMVWGRTLNDQGYMLEFKFDDAQPNELIVSVYRNTSKIVQLTSTVVSTSAMTSVNADSSSFDVRSSAYLDLNTVTNIITNPAGFEVWVSVDMRHTVSGVSTMTATYTIEMYESGANGKLNNGSPISTKTKFLQVTEGYSAVSTIGVASQYGFLATSLSSSGIITDVFAIETTQQSIAPTDENLTVKKTRIYNQGPIRYMMWVTTPLRDAWGEFSTGSKGTTSLPYDPLDSAQILINGKTRTELEEAAYFSVAHPLSVLGRSLPSGVHLYSFGRDIRTFEPDASMNFGRAGDITLYQRYRKYNPDATVLADLRDSESLPKAQSLKRILVYLVGYNVLKIVDGTMALWRV